MNQKIAKEALSEVEQEQNLKLKEELKSYIRKTLEAKEQKKALREQVNEEIRILDKDLEDLKAGNLDNIKERQQKSQTASNTSQFQIVFQDLTRFNPVFKNANWYHGTYETNYKIYYL